VKDITCDKIESETAGPGTSYYVAPEIIKGEQIILMRSIFIITIIILIKYLYLYLVIQKHPIFGPLGCCYII
jgi:hypothetical protein